MRGYLGGPAVPHGASRRPRSASAADSTDRRRPDALRSHPFRAERLQRVTAIMERRREPRMVDAEGGGRAGAQRRYAALLRGAGSDRVEGTTVDDETFEPPNEGTWELDTTHNTRPITWFTRSALASGFPRGFAEGLARYGLLLGRYDVAVIGGFMYAQRLPYGFGGTATPEQMRARTATS